MQARHGLTLNKLMLRAGNPLVCPMSMERLFTIASGFGLSIAFLVFAAASFSGCDLLMDPYECQQADHLYLRVA